MAAKFKNIVYFIEWGIYARQFNVADIDWSRVTHINYAFGKPNADGTVGLFDSWSAVEKRYPGDSWDQSNNVYGQFGQANKMKRKYRNTKFGLSIGGWTLSDKFSGICSTDVGRKTFVQSSVQMMIDLGLDFISLDWEYPVEGGNDQSLGTHSPNDIKNFVLLLKEFREAYKNLDFKAELSVASPAGASKYKHWDMPSICGLLDHINIMAYDFSGGWGSYTDHSSNLYLDPNHPPGDKFSVHGAVTDYIQMGCPSEKIVLGVPLYGHSFENTEGLYNGFSKPTDGSWLPGGEGIYDYKRLPFPGSIELYDEKLVASYTYNPSEKKFISYESPRSMAVKLQYIKDMKLGGTMFWEGSADHTAGFDRSLITQAYNFYGMENMAYDLNNINYPMSKYDNIRNGSSVTPRARQAATLAPRTFVSVTSTPSPMTTFPPRVTTTPSPVVDHITPAKSRTSQMAASFSKVKSSSGNIKETTPTYENCGSCTNCYYALTNACFVGWNKYQCNSLGFVWCAKPPTPTGEACGSCTNCYYAPTDACFVGWNKYQCTSIGFSWCGN